MCFAWLCWGTCAIEDGGWGGERRVGDWNGGKRSGNGGETEKGGWCVVRRVNAIHWHCVFGSTLTRSRSRTKRVGRCLCTEENLGKSWLKAWACASTLDAENSRCMYAVKSTTATTTRVKPPVVPLHCPNVTLHEEILIHHHRSDPARPGCAFHA